MQLNVIKSLVITFEPNGPKCDASKKVPNGKPLFVFLVDAMPKDTILPIELRETEMSSTAKFKDDLDCPFPNPLSLTTIPTSMLDGFFGEKEAVNALG